MARLCLVAGDPSGDAHAALLVEALRRLNPSMTFTGLGGPHMRDAGVELLQDLTQTASIGPFDAARHLGRFAQARRIFAEHLASAKPDAVILVDFGDFNLPVMAPLAKRAGCKVLYYISPQLWAWGRFRLRWVRRYVDRMIVFFKFEETFYKSVDVPVTWVGHPLLEHATPSVPREQAQAELGLNPWRMTVGLMPGSRDQEIRRHLPLLLESARVITWQMPGIEFLLPKAPQADATLFAAAVSSGVDVRICENRVYDCLQVMDAAIVASGTATVEAALFEVPMAVVYRTSWPTYLAAKAVVRVPHIAMVNVIAGKAIVPEFVQAQATPGRVGRAVVDLLRNQPRNDAMRQGLRKVREELGEPGAVARAARVVLEELRFSP